MTLDWPHVLASTRLFTEMVTMVVKVPNAEIVLRNCAERAFDAFEAQIVLDGKGTEIEQYVVIGAQAQNVVGRVWPMVRRAKRADVGPLGIWPSWGFEPYTANLALVFVQRLHVVGTICVPNDSLDGRLAASRFAGISWRDDHPGGLLRIVSDESESPDQVSRLSPLVPVPLDDVQAVVPVSFSRRETGASVCSTDDTNGQALAAADSQGQIITGEFLVGNLPSGGRIVTALTSVHDHVTKILIVFVAPGQDDGIRPIGPRSRRCLPEGGDAHPPLPALLDY
jgi:hypothetical protein